MKGIAQADEDSLYRMFGVDAELLIDHAWGREPTTIADIKKYKPKTHCLSSSQILPKDYSFEKGKLIVKEMMDALCLDLTDQDLVTQSVTLQVGYAYAFSSKPIKGTTRLPAATNLYTIMIPAVTRLYEDIVHPAAPIRKISITCNRVTPEGDRSLNLFEDVEEMEKNRRIQKTVLKIKKKYGKNAILKGMGLESGATTQQRNNQIGGHKSGEESKNQT